MKIHSILISLITGLLLATAASCKKEAGEGGSSSIRGQVKKQNWNGNYTQMNYETHAADEWVYIIYGDDVSYGNRERTNYNGQYEFKYLREGKYRIYIYSDDKTPDPYPNSVELNYDTVMVKDVEITKRKQVVDAPLITIYK